MHIIFAIMALAVLLTPMAIIKARLSLTHAQGVLAPERLDEVIKGERFRNAEDMEALAV